MPVMPRSRGMRHMYTAINWAMDLGFYASARSRTLRWIPRAPRRPQGLQHARTSCVPPRDAASACSARPPAPDQKSKALPSSTLTDTGFLEREENSTPLGRRRSSAQPRPVHVEAAARPSARVDPLPDGPTMVLLPILGPAGRMRCDPVPGTIHALRRWNAVADQSAMVRPYAVPRALSIVLIALFMPPGALPR